MNPRTSTILNDTAGRPDDDILFRRSYESDQYPDELAVFSSNSLDSYQKMLAGRRNGDDPTGGADKRIFLPIEDETIGAYVCTRNVEDVVLNRRALGYHTHTIGTSGELEVPYIAELLARDRGAFREVMRFCADIAAQDSVITNTIKANQQGRTGSRNATLEDLHEGISRATSGYEVGSAPGQHHTLVHIYYANLIQADLLVHANPLKSPSVESNILPTIDDFRRSYMEHLIAEAFEGAQIDTVGRRIKASNGTYITLTDVKTAFRTAFADLHRRLRKLWCRTTDFDLITTVAFALTTGQEILDVCEFELTAKVEEAAERLMSHVNFMWFAIEYANTAKPTELYDLTPFQGEAWLREQAADRVLRWIDGYSRAQHKFVPVKLDEFSKTFKQRVVFNRNNDIVAAVISAATDAPVTPDVRIADEIRAHQAEYHYEAELHSASLEKLLPKSTTFMDQDDFMELCVNLMDDVALPRFMNLTWDNSLPFIYAICMTGRMDVHRVETDDAELPRYQMVFNFDIMNKHRVVVENAPPFMYEEKGVRSTTNPLTYLATFGDVASSSTFDRNVMGFQSLQEAGANDYLIMTDVRGKYRQEYDYTVTAELPINTAAERRDSGTKYVRLDVNINELTSCRPFLDLTNAREPMFRYSNPMAHMLFHIHLDAFLFLYGWTEEVLSELSAGDTSTRESIFTSQYRTAQEDMLRLVYEKVLSGYQIDTVRQKTRLLLDRHMVDSKFAAYKRRHRDAIILSTLRNIIWLTTVGQVYQVWDRKAVALSRVFQHPRMISMAGQDNDLKRLKRTTNPIFCSQ